MKVFNNIEELIGNTPLVQANNLKKEYDLYANIFLKLEGFNPAGSIKDRVALSMLNQAVIDGLIKEGATIIEPTSGNTGIGVAAICASKGFKAVIVMPDSMSVERIKLIKAYGAEVVLTVGKKGMVGAIEKAEEIKRNTPNSMICGQFENPSNPQAHYQTTGKEIYQDLDGKIDYFVAGIGTGGTISGTAKYLKERNADITVIGVEPKDSPLISKGVYGSHKIQGIGANFIPKNLDLSLIDEIKSVTTESSYEWARILAKKEGYLVGISSGAALSVAIEYAKKEENTGKNIVVILPDTGDRYLSTDLFN